MRKLVPNKTVNRRFETVKAERCPNVSKAVRELKGILRKQFLGQFADLHLLDLTLNEAESAAWSTGMPHLFFPMLAEEKLFAALQWAKRQRALKAATSELCFAA